MESSRGRIERRGRKILGIGRRRVQRKKLKGGKKASEADKIPPWVEDEGTTQGKQRKGVVGKREKKKTNCV